jgi:hypothetical protein
LTNRATSIKVKEITFREGSYGGTQNAQEGRKKSAPEKHQGKAQREKGKTEGGELRGLARDCLFTDTVMAL